MSDGLWRDGEPVFVPIGSWPFELVMHTGPLFNEDGTECLARIDWERHRILIGSRTPGRLTYAVAATAVAHAWKVVTKREGGGA